MASRYAAAAGRRKSPIDLPLAAAAALAVGFAAFVVPADILTRLVEASGLPAILSAAQPPLGTTARLAVSAAAALAAFGAVFMLLRLLGEKASPERGRDRADPFKIDEPDEVDAIAPRLRRADVHPDAPARRPILAARELGEPERDPAPAAPPQVQELAAEPEPELSEADPPLDELDLIGPDIEMIVAEPVPEAPPAPAEVAAPSSEPVADATIAELMARLERGLARRLGEKAAVPERREPVEQAEPASPPSSIRHGGDDRLRNAIENLQRMAIRAG